MGFKMPHNGEGPHIIGSLKGAPPLKFKGVQELYLDVQEHLPWVQRKVNNTLRYNHDEQDLSLELGHISNMVFKMPQDGEGFSVVELLSGYQLCGVLLPSCSILKSDDQFARQNRYGIPPEFPLASFWPGIVNHLLGPNWYALGIHRPRYSHCAFGFSSPNDSHTC